jgi:hypothetical protein
MVATDGRHSCRDQISGQPQPRHATVIPAVQRRIADT